MPSQKQVVLGLLEGESFPTPKTHNEQVYVKARLDNVWLDTEAVKAESNPDLNTELVWDMTKAQLKALRTKKAPIKVEVWQSDDKLGYLVLDLRNALPYREGEHPVVNKMKLLGSKHKPIPSLQVSLSMEDVPGDEEEDSVTESLSVSANVPSLSERGSVVNTRYKESSNSLIPELDEENRYFRIGPKTRNQQKFSFGVNIVFARNLDLLLPSDLAVDPNDQFYFHYDLLGEDMTTEPFKWLAERDWKAEKATALIKSTAASMEQFFEERGNLSVNVVRDTTIIGEASLDLSAVMPVKAEAILSSPVTYEGKIPVVSRHNCRINKNDKGDFPMIGIEVFFRKEDFTITPDASKDITSMDSMDVETTQDNLELTQGQLSSSEIQQLSISSESLKADTVTKQKEQNGGMVDLTDFPSPNKIPDQVSLNIPAIPSSTAASPPVRLQVSPREKHPRNVSVELFPDDTIYLSPPKQPRLTPSPGPSKPHPPPNTSSQTSAVLKPQVFAPEDSSVSAADSTRFSQVKSVLSKPENVIYKWMVDLKTIIMNRDFGDLTLRYKYKPFSRSEISTKPGFSVRQGKTTAIPRGFCEYNFTTSETKLKSTLAKHFLEIHVDEDDVETVGQATINQSAVFSVEPGQEGRVYEGVADIVNLGIVVGKLQYELCVQTPEIKLIQPPPQPEVVELDKMEVEVPVAVHVVDPAIRAKMTAEAARELELWKFEQKKKHLDNLEVERQQHFTTLGAEWKERQVAREMELQQEKEVLQGHAKELQKSIENYELKNEEIKKQWVQLEEEKSNLRNEKGKDIEKYKSKQMSAEGELRKQTLDLEILQKKARHLEDEVVSLEKEKATNRTKHVQAIEELTKLRAEKTTWKTRLEERENTRDMYKKTSLALKTELDQLKSDKQKMQLDTIERLEREASDHKKKASNDELRIRELSYWKRQHSTCKSETKNVSSEITNDSIFEDSPVAENVFRKPRTIDTDLPEKLNSRSLSEAGNIMKTNSIGEELDVIKFKQRNREDIARIRQTKSVQSFASNNSKILNKQLSLGGENARKENDCLEDEITLSRPGSRSENSDMTRMRPDSGMKRMTESSLDDVGMTSSSPKMIRKKKHVWGGGVPMPVMSSSESAHLQELRKRLRTMKDEEDMLLRTGVYPEDDPVVTRLRPKILEVEGEINQYAQFR